MKPPYRFEIVASRHFSSVHVNGQQLIHVDNDMFNVPLKWWKPATWPWKAQALALSFWCDPNVDRISDLSVASDTLEENK